MVDSMLNGPIGIGVRSHKIRGSHKKREAKKERGSRGKEEERRRIKGEGMEGKENSRSH